jgi:C-terminal processing protease CtpA/Prc
MPQATGRQHAQILARGAILSLVLAFAIRGPAQIPTRSDPKLLHKTFDAVWNTVNNKFYDPTFGGVDWVAVRKKYEPQIEAVRSDTEFRDLLNRMLSEIKISHLSILDLENLDKLLARAEVTRGLTLRDLDNQVVVTRIVEASSAATRGVQPGFIVKSIDGVAVTNARDAERTLATDAANHRLAVVDETNTKREIEVAHKLPPKDRLESTPLLTGARYALIETRILDGKVGYIHFTNFIGPLQKKFRPIFDSMKDTAGIVIDLRGNSGGETEVGLVLAPISTTQTRKGAGNRYTARPQAKPYLGKVVILLDEGSASESEELAGGLQAAGRVVVIGRTSRGEDMDATFQGLPMKSIALLYPVGLPRTIKGVIEGRGVMPDIDVRLTRAELLEGKDSQLDTAIRHIRGLIR